MSKMYLIMRGFFKDIWWLYLLEGIALLLFGLAAVLWPGLTLASLLIIFSVYILISGIMNLLIAIGSLTQRKAWFLRLLLGIVEIGASIYVLKTPGVGISIFIIAIAAIFTLQGIFSIIGSFVDTRDGGMKFLEIAYGILAIIVGVVVFQNPVAGGISFIWVLGLYGLIAGTITIAEALSLRHAADEAAKEMGRLKASTG